MGLRGSKQMKFSWPGNYSDSKHPNKLTHCSDEARVEYTLVQMPLWSVDLLGETVDLLGSLKRADSGENVANQAAPCRCCTPDTRARRASWDADTGSSKPSRLINSPARQGATATPAHIHWSENYQQTWGCPCDTTVVYWFLPARGKTPSAGRGLLRQATRS